MHGFSTLLEIVLVVLLELGLGFLANGLEDLLPGLASILHLDDGLVVGLGVVLLGVGRIVLGTRGVGLAVDGDLAFALARTTSFGLIAGATALAARLVHASLS